MWLWFKERMPNGLDVAFIFAPLTALGYGLSYMYYIGFFEVYRIPYIFIDIDLMKLTETLLFLIGIIALTLLLMLTGGQYGYWFNKMNDMMIKYERWKNQRLVDDEQNTVEDEVENMISNNENESISFLMYVGNLSKKIYYYGKIILTIILGFMLLVATSKIDTITISGIIILSIGLIFLFKHFNLIKTIIIFILSVLFLLSYLLGISNAMNKEEYLVVKNKSESYVVLNTYKDKLLIAPLHNQEITPDFKIIETGEKIDDYNLTLTKTGVLNTLLFNTQKNINKPEILKIKEELFNIIRNDKGSNDK